MFTKREERPRRWKREGLRRGQGGGVVPGEGRKFPERVKSPRRRKTDCSEGNSSPRWKRGYVGGRERPRRGKKVYEAGRKSEERGEGLRRRGEKSPRRGKKGTVERKGSPKAWNRSLAVNLPLLART